MSNTYTPNSQVFGFSFCGYIVKKQETTALNALFEGLPSNENPSARKKCLALYLRAKGYARDTVADIARIDPDTVTNHVKNYADGGLKGYGALSKKKCCIAPTMTNSKCLRRIDACIAGLGTRFKNKMQTFINTRILSYTTVTYKYLKELT